MRLLNFTIIKLTICLISGIFIGHFSNLTLYYSLLLTVSLLLVLIILFVIARKQFIKSVWFGITAFLLMISIGILITNFHNQKNLSSHYTQSLSSENDEIKKITFRVKEALKSNTYYDKYVVDILQVEDKTVSGKTLLNIQKDSLHNPLKIDAYYISKTDFKTINAPLNPNQFDYKVYLENKYIYHQLSITHHLLLNIPSESMTLFGIADNIREHINKKIKPFGFKPDELAIMNALLLGQRQDISKDIYTSYTNAGVIHILAVSGLHIGIILLILQSIFKPLERFKYGILIKTLLIVSLLWSFALIAGLSASVTRAVTMFSIVAIAKNLKRPTNIYNTLAISMFVILLFKPLFIFDVGFQLSYMAVFAIVTFHPLLYKLWKPKNKILGYFWNLSIVTLSAQFGILPLSLYYFHNFPGLFFISNLVIIPLLGFILGFGILLIFLAVLNILPQFLANIFAGIINIMNRFVSWISHQESFLLKDISFSLLYIFVFYLLIITLTRLLIKRNYLNLKLFLIAILLVQGAFIYKDYNKPLNAFIVFHKSRYSVLGNVTNNKILVANDFDSTTKSKNRIIRDYTVGNHIKNIEEQPFCNVYQLKSKYLLIVDSLGVYNVKSLKPDYILLRQSPKINLNRLIDSLNPKKIIADGSNYKSYVKHWEVICKKRKRPFHQTSKKGAFIIDY